MKYFNTTHKIFLTTLFCSFAFLSAFFVAIFLISDEAYAYARGDGTPGDPYRITSCEELQDMRLDLDAHYQLDTHIDCFESEDWNSGAGFEPVGSSGTPFTGTLKGKLYYVLGLTIDRPGTNNIGLFGYTQGATIEMVSLRDADITGGNCTGGFIGTSDNSTLSGLHVSGDVVGGDGVGGVIGCAINGGSIMVSSFDTGTVTGANSVGGFVGENAADISHSIMRSTLSASASGNRAGSFAGVNTGLIELSYATGNVLGVAQVGGLVGENSGDILHSYALSDAVGNNQVGGLVGGNTGNITRSYSTGQPTGSADVGGLIGTSTAGIVADSFWDIETSGQPLSAGGAGAEGVTTSQMKHPDTFALSNWDIAVSKRDVNDGYPFLTWETGTTTPVWSIQFGPLSSPGIGTGASGDPYVITTCEDLQSIQEDLASHYILGQDIDCSDTVNWNSGAGFIPIGALSGTLDGKGFEVLDLYIYATSLFQGFAPPSALFSSNNGVISNLGVQVNISTDGFYAGGIVGTNQRDIINSYTAGMITMRVHQTSGSIGFYSGGLAALNDGAVGFSAFGTITDSYSTATVVGGSGVGGLVGQQYGGFAMIENSYATGNVTASQPGAGGLVGENYASIENSYATGNVAGPENVGGFAGRNIGCCADPDAGFIISGTIVRSFATGNVTENGASQDGLNFGGLVGVNTDEGVINDSYATGDVHAGDTDRIGGFVGSSESGTIERSYSAGSVSATANTAGSLGGFAGSNSGTITNSLWNTDTAGTAISAGGTGTTTAAMLDIATFQTAGWGIATTSVHNPGTGNPFLSWQVETSSPVWFLYLAPPPAPEPPAEETSSRSSGSTVQGRVRNLTTMGKTDEAETLKNEWPQLFSDASSDTNTPSPSVTPPTTCPSYTFTRNLRLGDKGEDVRALQKLLNCLGFTLASNGPGSPGNETTLFRTLTHNAVIRFQEAHTPDILTPLNLTKGTGIFAEMSKKKMYELMGKNSGD